jgi:hypothetical protein
MTISGLGRWRSLVGGLAANQTPPHPFICLYLPLFCLVVEAECAAKARTGRHGQRRFYWFRTGIWPQTGQQHHPVGKFPGHRYHRHSFPFRYYRWKTPECPAFFQKGSNQHCTAVCPTEKNSQSSGRSLWWWGDNEQVAAKPKQILNLHFIHIVKIYIFVALPHELLM